MPYIIEYFISKLYTKFWVHICVSMISKDFNVICVLTTHTVQKLQMEIIRFMPRRNELSKEYNLE